MTCFAGREPVIKAEFVNVLESFHTVVILYYSRLGPCKKTTSGLPKLVETRGDLRVRFLKSRVRNSLENLK